MRDTLASVGEDALLGLIARWLRRQKKDTRLVKGAGDDCATLKRSSGRILLTSDAMVEGVHFRQAWAKPGQIGWKALAANVSDIAAAGGRPGAALLSLELPPELKLAWLRAFFTGIIRCAGQYGVILAGGNLSRGRRIAVHVSLMGDAPPRRVGRENAQPGDILAVTGSLGGARAGLLCLERRLGGRDGGAAARRHLLPRPQLAAGRTLARCAHAQIDVSDGLIRDAGRLARASGTGMIIFPTALPVNPAARRLAPRLHVSPSALALTSGEEYEILSCLARKDFLRFRSELRRGGCKLTAIGLVCKDGGLMIAGPTGKTGGGWDHFAHPSK